MQEVVTLILALYLMCFFIQKYLVKKKEALRTKLLVSTLYVLFGLSCYGIMYALVDAICNVTNYICGLI